MHKTGVKDCDYKAKKYKKYLTYCTGGANTRRYSRLLLVSDLHGLKTIKTYSTDIRPFCLFVGLLFLIIFYYIFIFILLFVVLEQYVSSKNHSTTKRSSSEIASTLGWREKEKEKHTRGGKGEIKRKKRNNYFILFYFIYLFPAVEHAAYWRRLFPTVGPAPTVERRPGGKEDGRGLGEVRSSSGTEFEGRGRNSVRRIAGRGGGEEEP